jgi:D-Tyr-tRNAtyr deacylase
VDLFRETGLTVKTGRFQERMMVHIQNDGPVTIAIDSADRHRPRRG